MLHSTVYIQFEKSAAFVCLLDLPEKLASLPRVPSDCSSCCAPDDCTHAVRCASCASICDIRVLQTMFLEALIHNRTSAEFPVCAKLVSPSFNFTGGWCNRARAATAIRVVMVTSALRHRRSMLLCVFVGKIRHGVTLRGSYYKTQH